MTQIKVGAFLFAGIMILLVTVFTIGSNSSLFQEVIEVQSYFDSVQGLNKGAVVSLAGVKIGNVENIAFDENRNLVRVTSVIDSSFRSKLRTDSRVEIRTQGALGDKYLYVTPGSSEEFVTNDSELVADYGNDILSVISKRGNESEHIFDILKDLKTITHALAENNKVGHVTNNLEKASANLVQLTEQLNKTVKSGSLDRSAAKLEKILDKVDRGEGTLGALINDNSVHERIKSILGAGQKSQQVRSILKSSVEE
ncbi:MlaD family protein [Pseudobdellovibrio exovorus]|uniref:ABC transporter substrate binding protein n=1 Tax=Pseudobdellovibrio exovorus JSS TaxID=1184267 RepID=M4VEA5_9BACT|nr:MlaD family protein [Pseudobdellovibrio exovorus]AGH96371.1 ABC transporter substrate binding protein [Pseudobdellovibrio exovorus JSS]